MLIGVLQTFAVAIDYSLQDALRAAGIALARTSPFYEFASVKVATAAPIVPYLLLVLMLIVRPRGLLGKRDA
jgi:branched-chain amino acid transport system permease protein